VAHPPACRSALERAVPGIWLVDAPRLPPRNKRHDDSHKIHVAFIPYQMDVEALVYETRSSSIPVRCA